MNALTNFPQTSDNETPFLPPSERVEALMDLVSTNIVLQCAQESAFAEFESTPRSDPGLTALGEKADAAVEAWCRNSEEIVAHVKILMGNGTLERCAHLLRHPPVSMS
jgi:hypothetical protein